MNVFGPSTLYNKGFIRNQAWGNRFFTEPCPGKYILQGVTEANVRRAVPGDAPCLEVKPRGTICTESVVSLILDAWRTGRDFVQARVSQLPPLRLRGRTLPLQLPRAGSLKREDGPFLF